MPSFWQVTIFKSNNTVIPHKICKFTNFNRPIIASNVHFIEPNCTAAVSIVFDGEVWQQIARRFRKTTKTSYKTLSYKTSIKGQPVGWGGYGTAKRNCITEKEVVKISEDIAGFHVHDDEHSRRWEDLLIRYMLQETHSPQSTALACWTLHQGSDAT